MNFSGVPPLGVKWAHSQLREAVGTGVLCPAAASGTPHCECLSCPLPWWSGGVLPGTRPAFPTADQAGIFVH